MRLRIGGLALGVMLGAAVLISGAGASTHQVAIPGSTSSKAEITRYLVSVGVNPSGFVVQRGAHNYAGPKCPGRGWTCTTATRVLQIAADSHKGGDDGGGDNTFQCTTSTGGSSSAPTDCTIVQVSTGGDNNARCVEPSGDASVSQSCAIFQTNSTGDNHLVVRQMVAARGGATQNATQYAGVEQVNGTGSNDARIGQDLSQSTRDADAAGTQTQDGHQGVFVSQTSDTGDNGARVDQSLALNATATGATVSQNQNTDSSNGLNTSAGITQSSNTGGNTARLNQRNDLDGTVARTSNGSQTQGFPGGGLNAFFSQNSTGLSTVKLNQREHQDLTINGGDNRDNSRDGHGKKTPPPPPGVVTQTQWGPMWSDPNQGSNPANLFDINQSSSQHASNGALQDDRAYGQCDTSGNCTVDQRIGQNGKSQTNSCSGASCDIGLIVTTNSDGTNTSTCTGQRNSDNGDENTCPSPPPPPPPPDKCRLSGCDTVVAPPPSTNP